jgi:hypothetical protein
MGWRNNDPQKNRGIGQVHIDESGNPNAKPHVHLHDGTAMHIDDGSPSHESHGIPDPPIPGTPYLTMPWHVHRAQMDVSYNDGVRVE